MKASLLPVVKTSTLSTNLTFLRELRRKYRYLYAEKVRNLPDGSTAFHRGRLFRRQGLSVLHLKGDSFEMAYQHGKLLEEEVRTGVLHQLSCSIPHLLHNSVSRSPLLNRIVIGLVDYMGQNLKQHIPWDYLAESFALSEGSGLALHHVSNALLAMEAMYILAKYAVRSKGFDITPMAFAGCSSFAAWKDFSRDGELVIGRNLDYPLNGYFDRYPTVTYYEPTDHGQRYVALGTAGLHTPSLTAMNESGIYIAGHLVPTEETSFQGTPMYFVAADVIKQARTFDEAVDRFRQHRTTVGWAYVLCSTREKRVASVEMTNARVAVRESTDGLHVQSNHFSLIESSNLYVNRSIADDTEGRYCRMRDRVRGVGKVDAREAAAIMGDCFDPVAGRERGLGATVAVHITVGSAVFRPSEGKMYVANGTAPTSQNDFVELPLLERFDPDTFAKEKFTVIPATHDAAMTREQREAVQAYIEAKMAYEYDSDVDRAFDIMKRVVATDPQNAAYRFILASFAMKQEKLDEAVTYLSDVVAMDHTPQLRNLAYYYRGRIHASRGDRARASVDFSEVIGSPDTDDKLRRAAKKADAIVRIFGKYAFRTDNLPIMMQFADMLTY